jgi:hypothetical protein
MASPKSLVPRLGILDSFLFRAEIITKDTETLKCSRGPVFTTNKDHFVFPSLWREASTSMDKEQPFP